jgi:hypothetical protein
MIWRKLPWSFSNIYTEEKYLRWLQYSLVNHNPSSPSYIVGSHNSLLHNHVMRAPKRAPRALTPPLNVRLAWLNHVLSRVSGISQL